MIVRQNRSRLKISSKNVPQILRRTVAETRASAAEGRLPVSLITKYEIPSLKKVYQQHFAQKLWLSMQVWLICRILKVEVNQERPSVWRLWQAVGTRLPINTGGYKQKKKRKLRRVSYASNYRQAVLIYKMCYKGSYILIRQPPLDTITMNDQTRIVG